ncbi:hypothetical protein B0H16DRAFT_1894527 [Mycena metata]|uniref:mitogen-activated protein kinase kinase n=1 Tax=Mycena metata TaxID=1033252 RepID=A0AAD7MQ85_9AGAR|nr:hypothetical protein B0H16DRAFT_1894527 [Mycena metata]
MSAKELERRIDKISAEIAVQRKLLKQLEHSKSATQRQLNSLRDLVARLPLEISSEIFLRCLPDYPPKPGAGLAPMLLLHICNAWSEIALSNPALWSTIHLNFPGAEILQLWLERARNQTLSIALYSGLSDAVVDVIMPSLAFAQGTFPCLQTLTIGSDAQSDYFDLSVLRVLDVLRTAPNLLECTFHGLNTHDEPSIQGTLLVALPNLTCMKFERNTYGDSGQEHVLAYLELPSLQTLFCSTTCITGNDFLLFLRRSSPPLRRLVIDNTNLESLDYAELDQCLRLVPTLVHLELYAGGTSVNEFLTAFADSPSDFIPNLQNLAIRHSGCGPSYETLLHYLSSYYAPFDEHTDHDWEHLDHNDPLTLVLSVHEDVAVRRFPVAGGLIIVKSYTLSLWPYGEVDRSIEEHTWIMMMLAGDCCVRVSGRLFSLGKPAGFCMPMETPIIPADIATREERIQLIKQVHDLVTELHAKNIVHGDVKPQNLLMCSDGRMRFCDFDNASVEGDGYSNPAYTLPYCSQFRFRHPEVPMTRAEDTYALGLTIWELYTGRIPLSYGDETREETLDSLEHRVNVGMGPDMQVIDDPQIYALIETCLADGPDCPDEYWPDPSYCVETQVELGLCRAQPRHLYSRIVHATFCPRVLSGEDVPCEYTYVSRKVKISALESVCTKCNPGVGMKCNQRGVEYFDIPS